MEKVSKQSKVHNDLSSFDIYNYHLKLMAVTLYNGSEAVRSEESIEQNTCSQGDSQ